MNEKTQVTLRIEGMTCEGCARHAVQGLQALPGVERATVRDWREGTAVVVAHVDVTDDALLQAVVNTGYRGMVRTFTSSD